MGGLVNRWHGESRRSRPVVTLVAISPRVNAVGSAMGMARSTSVWATATYEVRMVEAEIMSTSTPLVGQCLEHCRGDPR